MKRVFVSGFGAVSPIGIGVASNLEKLRSGQSVFSPARILKTTISAPIAEVPYTNVQLSEWADIPFNPNYSRSFLMAFLAAREALEMAHIDDRDGMPLVACSTSTGVEMNEESYRDTVACKGMLNYFHSSQIPTELSKALGITGRLFCVSTACASSANGIQLAARLIANGKADRILVGGYDAQSRFSLNGFNALEIASPTGCRPFDRNRDGATLGEAAAFLVLESEEAAKGKTVLGEVVGYANINEAFHATSISPEGDGAKRVMTEALKCAGVEARDVSYINAHGTGTRVNDFSESVALAELFGEGVPVSSTKGYTGHTLAACGVLEAVYSLLAIREQMVWANNRLLEPLDEVKLNYIRTTQSAKIDCVLSNSFGFGGNATAIVFKKV